MNGKGFSVGCLRPEEVQEAELTILRDIQKECYSFQLRTLEAGLPLTEKAGLSQLLPAWDPRDNLIRVPGRMELAI